ncbi:hypothetical protein Tsubulata_043974 [Turnera subulata]|uniref:RING-type domain-containing protein n=1 Tax=Turnera subulata TaxID=218843 RepID=A0A9Q0JNX9_9ROSI|nr:hypothetical protein Tsubulata_043974 [Turnera subulata]
MNVLMRAHLSGNLMNSRQTRWIGLDLDLNYPPPEEKVPLYGTHSTSVLSPQNAQTHGVLQDGANQPIADDVHVIDSEIAIISPQIFAEAKKNSKRNIPHATGQDILSAPASKSALCPPESSHHQKVPTPESAVFRCPICLDELREATSTKCGHIFCKECIESAFAASKKCPNCRKKYRGKALFRVHFPALVTSNNGKSSG